MRSSTFIFSILIAVASAAAHASSSDSRETHGVGGARTSGEAQNDTAHFGDVVHHHQKHRQFQRRGTFARRWLRKIFRICRSPLRRTKAISMGLLHSPPFTS